MAYNFNKSVQEHSDNLDRLRKKYPKGSTEVDWKKGGDLVVKKAKSKALKKASSFDRINKERKSAGAKPIKDRATKGLYDFLDKYD